MSHRPFGDDSVDLLAGSLPLLRPSDFIRISIANLAERTRFALGSGVGFGQAALHQGVVQHGQDGTAKFLICRETISTRGHQAEAADSLKGQPGRGRLRAHGLVHRFLRTDHLRRIHVIHDGLYPGL